MLDKAASNSYQVLAGPCEYTHEEKRSLFTAVLLPVTSRGQAMEALEELRQSRPGASHYCWAYVLGDAHQPESQAFNDDGEPGGPAGKPILNVLSHRQAGNCLAVVVRVFGGVKLGAGGLVRAYSAAVSHAAERAVWQTLIPTAPALIEADFAWEERIRHCLAQKGFDVERVSYGQGVLLNISVSPAEFTPLADELRQITSGQARITLAG
jgi:uncharacterized YigZ family protein